MFFIMSAALWFAFAQATTQPPVTVIYEEHNVVSDKILPESVIKSKPTKSSIEIRDQVYKGGYHMGSSGY